MIGSDSETGRSGQLGAFLGAPQREAKGDPHTGSDWPWAEVVRCLLCEKERKLTASCEQHEQVLKMQEEWLSGRALWPKPRCTAICRDCCIAELGGHQCIWWDLCWRG